MISPPSHCAPALDWLQSRLDGSPAAMPDFVSSHVSGCSDCRERFAAAERFIGAGSRSTATASPLMIERIVTTVRRDYSRRRAVRIASGVAGIAATVALALWLTQPIPPHPGEGQIVREPPVAPAPSLRTELAGVGESALSLARRAAETVGDTRLLVPKVELPKLASVAIAVAKSPLDSAGKGVADGIEPVATSARRAMNLFLREPPAESDEKTN